MEILKASGVALLECHAPHFCSAIYTTDGGFILAGSTARSDLPSEGYLLKTDSQGNIICENVLQGPSQSEDGISSIRQTSDGGFVLVGMTTRAGGRDAYLVKTNPQCDVVWERTFGEGNLDIVSSVHQTIDEGYILAGLRSSGEGNFMYMGKTDRDGNLIWERTFGGTPCDEARSVQQTTDGGYILAGHADLDGIGGMALVKTDENGNSPVPPE